MNSAQVVNSGTIETILLLALPASGKSEIRKFLAGLSPQECQRDFHLGSTVQLDDFPYVHLMRRIDDEVAARGGARIYFSSSDKPFKNGCDWGTLIALVNEDYEDLLEQKTYQPKSAAGYFMERLDSASFAAGAPTRLKALEPGLWAAVGDALERECQDLLREKNANSTQDLKGKTVVIEFARGGAQGSQLPLQAPYGYRYSLSMLSEKILSKARILYVWVTPEESRRKNADRADPNDPGSILHHGVPIDVMLGEYGCDDMEWLESYSDRPGTVSVKVGGRNYYLPLSRFDNRVDKTSFIRGDRNHWKPEQVKAIYEGLSGALTKLAKFNPLASIP